MRKQIVRTYLNNDMCDDEINTMLDANKDVRIQQMIAYQDGTRLMLKVLYEIIEADLSVKE